MAISKQQMEPARPWWNVLSAAEAEQARGVAEVGISALRGLAQSVKAEAVAQLVAAVVSEVGASAAASGYDFTQVDVLLTRLERSILDRARMLMAIAPKEASHG